MIHISEISKVYSVPEMHCAFTDIIQYKNEYLLGFKEGPEHMVNAANHGTILSSKDGKTWEKVLEISCGKDTREPKFMILKGRLFCYFFTIEPSPDKTRYITDSWCIWTDDGRHWSSPIRFAQEVKYWHPVSFKDQAYCITHPKDPAADRPCQLMTSCDGIHWNHLYDVSIPYTEKPTEASITFDSKGDLYGLIRCDRGKYEAYLLSAKPPYDHLEEKSLKMRFGGPLIWCSKDRIYIGARFFTPENFPHTGIFYLENGEHPVLITVLPSMGDSSYMGITPKINSDGYLISYYSSHENLGGDQFSHNKSSIYTVDMYED